MGRFYSTEPCKYKYVNFSYHKIEKLNIKYVIIIHYMYIIYSTSGTFKLGPHYIIIYRDQFI